MSYKSPIEIEFEDPMTRITAQIQENNEMKIMATINQFVSVDKEELIKALNYDRQQYEKGYQEGHIDGVLQAEKLYARPQGEWVRHIRCIECSICNEKFFADDENENCQDYEPCTDFNFNYCPNCGADMKHQEVQE